MNTYGFNIKLRIYGGSHDEKIGVIISGIPSGEKIDMDALRAFMARRAPGNHAYSTKRKEPDEPVFLSGFDGNVTTGEEIEAVIYNKNQHSSDYSSLYDVPRPSHADFAARMKYGDKVDLRGGGHFSGRLTAPMCIAGGICLQILARKNIHVAAHIASIGSVEDICFDPVKASREDFESLHSHSFPTISEHAGNEMQSIIENARLDLDSIGGTVECAVIGLPAGLGEHMFMGVEGRISSIVFGIPAVKGIEFGKGFASASLFGSQNNDPFETDGTHIYTKTNNCGGILGGMTNGMPLIFRAAMKPTPSIGKEQDSVSLSRMENVKLTIGGRHDPCVVPRAVPVFEAACALAVMDMLLDE
jgi:chorismate synthase